MSEYSASVSGIPSKQVAKVSTQLLCEQVMRAIGVDRTESYSGIRADADWQGRDGENIRMIQQRGLGMTALYTIRVLSIGDTRPDVYRYSVDQDEVCQLDKDMSRTAIIMSPAFLNDRLHRAFISDEH